MLWIESEPLGIDRVGVKFMMCSRSVWTNIELKASPPLKGQRPFRKDRHMKYKSEFKPNTGFSE